MFRAVKCVDTGLKDQTTFLRRMKPVFSSPRIWVLLILVCIVPGLLAVRDIAIGEGPDELAHLDYVFFELARPRQPKEVKRSLYEPGTAPVGQGHQPAFSYWLAARVLSVMLSPENVGAFLDYQAGIEFSSEGALTGGGQSPCNVRMSPIRSGQEVATYRRALTGLRLWNTFLFAVSIYFVYLAGRRLYAAEHPALAMALLHAALPTAVWRSSFITNDNLLATIGSVVFYIAVCYMRHTSHLSTYALVGGCAAGLAFLTKYNGIACVGMILCAVILRQGTPQKTRALHLTSIIAVFAAMCAPDLYSNLRLDGDLFSKEAVIQEFPYLYKPLSLWAFLSNSTNLHSFVSRYWITMHNLGTLDIDFPLWKADIWYLLLAPACLGCAIQLVTRHRAFDNTTRFLLLAIISLVGTLAVVIYYNLAFPMPCGRYLHLTIGPAAFLITFGLIRLICLVASERVAGTAVAVLMSGVCVFGQHTTYHYQHNRYASCRTDTKWNVPGGVEPVTADLDADGNDEVVFYHRMQGKVFVAQDTTKGFAIDPTMTRTVGLPGDIVLSGDATGDGRDDLLLWRPSEATLYTVDATSVLTYDPSISPYRDRAVKLLTTQLPIYYRAAPQLQAVVADVDADRLADLLLYNSTRGRWSVVTNLVAWSPREPIRVRTIDTAIAMAVKLETKAHLVAYERESGRLSIATYGSKTLGSSAVEVNRHVRAADVDGDGTDELIMWRPDACLEVREFPVRHNDIDAPGEHCVAARGVPHLTEHHLLLPVRKRGRGTLLGIYDRRTAIMTVISVVFDPGTRRWKEENRQVFDPGFLGSAYRRTPFRALDQG